jgi:hypothetical protein
MLKTGKIEQDGKEWGEGGDIFRTVSHIVPCSGIQFIDLRIDREAIVGVDRSFCVEQVSLCGSIVWTLAPGRGAKTHTASTSGVDDPIILRVDGTSAIQAVLNRWLPLPLLRFLARDSAGQVQFDEGPHNWARIFLTADADPDGSFDLNTVRGVLAIDTQFARDARFEVAQYACPSLDDVCFGSTFALTDDAEQLAAFLAEDWVQSWLRVGDNVSPLDHGRTHADLTSVAAYLTLLTVIVRAKVVPSLQFLAPRADSVRPVPVDLILDIGDARTCGLLVEASGEHGRLDLARSQLLTLRDLSRPDVTFAGAFESRIEFARATFGDEALSRKSGRSHAFNWPSLARVGSEAMHLSRAEPSGGGRNDSGASGLSSPKHHIMDSAGQDTAWRFAPEARALGKRRQMVAGRMLAHMTETGLLPAQDRSTSLPALRPQFSRSAMMSFFIAEIVLQAVSAINAPVTGAERARTGAARILRNIIVSLPLALPDDEREMIVSRAESGVAMLWRALDWRDDAPDSLCPPLPVVRSGLDATLSVQIAFLYDEITERFSGDVPVYTELMGKSRPEFGVQPCVRIAAIDIGEWHTHASTVTYAARGDVPIKPTVLRTQRIDTGGAAARAALVAEILLPAIRTKLIQAGAANPEALLDQATVNAASGEITGDFSFDADVMAQWLQPAALALLTTYGELGESGRKPPFAISLGRLLGKAAVAAGYDTKFDAKAQADGATTFVLAEVAIRFDHRSIETTLQRCLRPMLTDLAATVAVDDCDIILLSGWLGRLGIVRDLLLEVLPARPDRIVSLKDRAWHGWYPLNAQSRVAADGKDIGLVGALLARADNLSASDLRFAAGIFSGPSTRKPDMIEAPRRARLEITRRRS